ncbi:MAG: Crp/Fnr family transcriptional regulator [Planctomycetota bacterium]
MAKGVKEEKQRKLLDQLRCEVKKGDTVFQEGETSRSLYILLSGTVEIRRGEKVIATVREKDTYLGEMSTLLGVPRTATVVAAEDAALLCVPEERVVDFFTHSPALGLKLAKILAQRLQDMNEKQEALLASAVAPTYDAVATYERLTATPARREMLKLYGRVRGGDAPLSELATTLGVSPAEAGRIIEDFIRAGLAVAEGEAVRFPAPTDKALERQIALFRGAAET